MKKTSVKKTWQVLIEPGVMKSVPILVATACGFLAGIIMMLVLAYFWPAQPSDSRLPILLLIVSANGSVFTIVFLLLRVWFSAINKRHIDACELAHEQALWEQTLDVATRVQLEYARAGKKPPAAVPSYGWRDPDEEEAGYT